MILILMMRTQGEEVPGVWLWREGEIRQWAEAASGHRSQDHPQPLGKQSRYPVGYFGTVFQPLWLPITRTKNERYTNFEHGMDYTNGPDRVRSDR